MKEIRKERTSHLQKDKYYENLLFDLAIQDGKLKERLPNFILLTYFHNVSKMFIYRLD